MVKRAMRVGRSYRHSQACICGSWLLSQLPQPFGASLLRDSVLPLTSHHTYMDVCAYTPTYVPNTNSSAGGSVPSKTKIQRQPQ